MKAEDIGKLILRFSTASLLLFHGSYKVFREIDSTVAMVENAGLPGALAYGAVIGEFIAPLFVIIGYKTRLAAAIMSVNMLMTILIAHRDIAFKLNDYWGWMIEFNVALMLGSLAIVFLGAGSLSLRRGRGKLD